MAAAVYDGHHGASVGIVTALSDLHDFATFASMAVLGVFTMALAAGGRSIGGAVPLGLLPGVRGGRAVPGGGARRGARLAGFLSLLSLALAAAAAVGAMIQLRRRWRLGGAMVRQQLALFAVAVALPIAVGPIVLLTGVGGWLFSAAALPLPVALGFAMLARGLYDLKTAANRGLVWLILSALVVGVYALVIAGAGSLLHDPSANWLPWLAAGVVAVLFTPLRDVLQRGINRVTFGRWDEPYEVLAALGQRLEATADADKLLADVVTELHDGLGLRDVAICDRQGNLVAGRTGTDASLTEVMLTAYGRQAGILRYRPPWPASGQGRPAS